MPPIVGIARVARRKAENITLRRDTEAEGDAIDVSKVTYDLIHLQNFAIAQAGAAHFLNRAFCHGTWRESEFPRVFKQGDLATIEFSRKFVRCQRPSHSVGPFVVPKQPAQTGEVMFDAIAASIQLADINSNRFEEPFRKEIALMMQHILVGAMRYQVCGRRL